MSAFSWMTQSGKRMTLRNLYCCSVAQSCLSLCDLTDCSMPGFPVLHCLLEFAQIHVHWIHWGLSLRQSDNLRWSFNFKIFRLYLGSISSCLVLCEHGEQTNIVTVLICTDVSLSKSTNSQKRSPSSTNLLGVHSPICSKASLLIPVCNEQSESHSVVSDSLRPHGL